MIWVRSLNPLNVRQHFSALCISCKTDQSKPDDRLNGYCTQLFATLIYFVYHNNNGLCNTDEIVGLGVSVRLHELVKQHFCGSWVRYKRQVLKADLFL
jgi:hypothetical protein